MDPLPIDGHIAEVVDALARARAAVLVADPGAGKTTRVPPALLAAGPLLLLQPRRAAARAVVRRIAEERGWTIGREIGWQIRFEKMLGRDTRLLVATEGILTARLQHDPLLSAFKTIVLDEFHERSIHVDLGLALAKEAWNARGDLRLLVMSATIDAQAVASYLDDCPILRVPGRLHPIDITYAPSQTLADAAIDLAGVTDGDVLCFLPGAREIQDAVAAIRGRNSALDVMPLHGALDARAQDAALSPRTSRAKRVVVSTNIAETSVTVPHVTAVVDSGLQKVARYDAARAIDSLSTERVTVDAADQRAGRAGRLAPGVVRRLWDARDRLRPHRQADIHRIDLSSVVLDIIAWGGHPRALNWFERPRRDAIDAALTLLERLGAIESGRLTAIGQQMRSLPLHPRLARILIAGEGSPIVAKACALLSERLLLPRRSATTSSDLLSAMDDWGSLPAHVHQAAHHLVALARDVKEHRHMTGLSDDAFRRALLAGYPDRVAQRREPRSSRIKLATGAGGMLVEQSGVMDGEFLLALDVRESARPGDADSRISMASMVDRDWIVPTSREIVHRIDESGTVRAARIDRYDALVLAETPVAIDEGIAAELLAARWLESNPLPEDERLLRRLSFAGCDVERGALAAVAAYGARSLSDVHLARALPHDLGVIVDREAPDVLVVPSGRSVRLEYGNDGGVSAAVKLQELFGLAETPRFGPNLAPVTFSLLAPNGRPVQVTRDLRSFWDRTYPEVRKELRGRYPKHAWPEDPWNAAPTARTKRQA